MIQKIQTTSKAEQISDDKSHPPTSVSLSSFQISLVCLVGALLVL